jgi:epoxyqueuosine reductase QueG
LEKALTVMDKKTLEIFVAQMLDESVENRIPDSTQLAPGLAGTTIFDEALVGIVSADDPWVISLQNNREAGLSMSPPSFWLPEAKTVISVFFRFSQQVRRSNAGGDWPSAQWLHGRIEGQSFINKLTVQLAELLKTAGWLVSIPSMDARFHWERDLDEKENLIALSSNWSERHVACAAGLGTFSLSRNIITKLGAAGRLTSIVTDMPLTADHRPYTDREQYCCHCGACAAVCPIDTISLTEGKNVPPCSDYLDLVLEKCEPYYGCGKCQVGVPCEDKIPVKD